MVALRCSKQLRQFPERLWLMLKLILTSCHCQTLGKKQTQVTRVTCLIWQISLDRTFSILALILKRRKPPQVSVHTLLRIRGSLKIRLNFEHKFLLNMHWKVKKCENRDRDTFYLFSFKCDGNFYWKRTKTAHLAFFHHQPCMSPAHSEHADNHVNVLNYSVWDQM